MKIMKRVNYFSFFFHQKGFTLIELLVVIAVIGILATIVLLAVNPAEQLRRGRDTSRVSGVTQLGRALQSYYTANGSVYPAQGTSWLTTLTSAGDVKLIPANPTYGTLPITPASTCTVGSFAQGGANTGYCYKTASSEGVVYQRLESNLYNSTKCTGVSAWWVFSTANAQAGLVCNNTEPAAGVQTFTP